MNVLTPSDYEINRRKRPRRKDRPCDACRKRKSRCVIKSGEDSCVHCQLRHSPCTFQHEPPERASLPGTTAGASPGAAGQVATLPSTHLAAEPSSTERGRTKSPPYPGSNSAGMLDSATSGRTAAEASHGLPVKAYCAAPGAAFGNDGFSLGGSRSRFAELYGLGSDMEPVLMVTSFSITLSLPLFLSC